MRNLILFSFISLLSNIASAENSSPSELKNILTNSFANIKTPIQFIVTDPNGFVGGEQTAVAQRFTNDPASKYRGLSFSPLEALVTIESFSDVSVRFNYDYSRVSVFNEAGDINSSFNTFSSNFYGTIICNALQDYTWSCAFTQVSQDFAGNLNPNPIEGYSIKTHPTKMGPNMAQFQSALLKVATEIHNSEY